MMTSRPLNYSDFGSSRQECRLDPNADRVKEWGQAPRSDSRAVVLPPGVDAFRHGLCNPCKFNMTTLILILVLFNATLAERNTSYVYPPWKHTWGVVRATPFKLRLLVGSKTRFDDPQGLACARLKAWEDTSRTGDDDEITVYGINSGDNCIVYNKSMFSLGIYGLDADHEKMNRPWGIAADSKGNVYVSDRGNSRVLRLFNSGKELHFVSVLGKNREISDPRGVALDGRGNVYVTDASSGCVFVYDDDGILVDKWSGFDGPDGIAVVGPTERWSFYHRDAFAVVVDSMHRRVRKLSLEGEILAETECSDWGVDEPFLGFVTLDYHNQILITDHRNGHIHKLDRNLTYLTSFGEPGRGKYQFDEPRGICIYRRFGQMVVAEREGAQYMWVAVDVPRFTSEYVRDSVSTDIDIRFYLTEPAYCEIDLVDEMGRFVTRLVSKKRFQAGEGFLLWDLRIPQKRVRGVAVQDPPSLYQAGTAVPAGSYTLRGRFRATYSSSEHFEKEVESKFTVE